MKCLMIYHFRRNWVLFLNSCITTLSGQFTFMLLGYYKKDVIFIIKCSRARAYSKS